MPLWGWIYSASMADLSQCRNSTTRELSWVEIFTWKGSVIIWKEQVYILTRISSYIAST